jgi:hypothetical protein
MNNIDIELRNLARNNSHPEFPLLRIGYSPGSRYPAADFTPWINEHILKHDFESIGYLFTELTAGSPSSPGFGTEYCRRLAIMLCNRDFQHEIKFSDEKGYLDLRAALIPYHLHGSLDGFMLVNYHTSFLCRVISPYKFSIPNLDVKIDRANKFIREMRKETKQKSAAWTEQPLLKTNDVEYILKSGHPGSSLTNILRDLSIGSRLMFLSTVMDGPAQGAWNVRPFGIDEVVASEEIANAGLGELIYDTELVLSMYRIEELLKVLSDHQIKQGWKKKRIIKYMIENTPQIAASLCDGKKALVIKNEYQDLAFPLLDWISSIKTPVAIALAF